MTRRSPLSVVLLMDVEKIDPGDPQFASPPPRQSLPMEHHVAAGLRGLGHAVRVLPCGPDAGSLVAGLAAARPDLVFNVTEHWGGDRHGDAHVAALLEMLDLPYTGTGPAGLSLCRDKAESKERLRRCGLAVPAYAVVEPGARRLPDDLPLPAIVKPLLGDGSDGICRASLAPTRAAALARAAFLHRATGKPAICEEYVEGRELKVALLGNRELEVLPPREVRFGSAGDGGPRFLTSQVKRDRRYRERWRVSYPRARLAATDLARVAAACRRAYRALGIRDYGKLDLRLAADGEVYVLEANPNPDLAPTGLGRIASWAGIDYPALLQRVADLALERHRS